LYEYICTHVDNFTIVAKLPAAIMKDLQEIYTINEELITKPHYDYLGNNYKKDKKGHWCIGCKRYLKEAILRVEKMYSTPLKKFFFWCR
jgi:hypothetical protein